jgi:cob(I)alamin adenosyltransferase
VVTRAPDEFTSAVATRKGDDGTTGLLYGGARIPKDDLRTEAYGTIDETVAELATNPDAWDRLEDGRTRVSAAMVESLETVLRDLEDHVEMPREFVVPGETPTSAALEVARTTCRRAERRAVALGREGLIPGPHLLPYLNRLADLLWVMARAAEQAESRSATPSRTNRKTRTPARSTD